MKSIFKEAVIIILLVIVIFLLLAIIFYEYMPISIAVPEKVEAYTTPEEIKDEADQDIAQYSKQTVSFEITDSDLTVYKQSKSYDASKANPFLPYYTDYYDLDSDSGTKAVNSNLDLGVSSSGGGTSSSNTSNGASSQSGNSSSTVFDTKLK